jgi:hypothetical protein
MTTDELRHIIATKRIKRWPVRSCSICNAPLSYIFDHTPSGVRPFYDSSCDCTAYRTAPEPRTWEAVLDYYERTLEWRATEAAKLLEP